MARVRAGVSSVDAMACSNDRRLASVRRVLTDNDSEGDMVQGGDSTGNVRSIGIGQLIREARELLGITQIKLAKMTGYTNGWISLVERGRVAPTRQCLRDLEEVLGDLGSADYVGRKNLGDVGNNLMTPTEVARYLEIPRQAVYKYMKVDLTDRERMDYVLVDKLRRVPIRSLARWLVNYNEVEATGACGDSLVMLIDQEETKIRKWLKERRLS